MSFHEVRLPENIERGAIGGPRFKTRVVILTAGHEKRNPDWSKSRGVWDIAYGIQNGNDLFDLIEFFYARQGKAFGFRFKDWSDYIVTASQIGVGDGIETQFQCLQTYTSGPTTFTRPLYKIVSGTLVVRVNAVVQTEGGGNDYTVDYNTGIITFNGGSIPPASQAVDIDCEFDVPVRFDTDELDVNNVVFDQTAKLSGMIPSIPLVELRIDGALI